MACNLFSVSEGYRICDPLTGQPLFEHFTGTGLPGGDGARQDDAPIGSFYTDTATGISYCKQTDTNTTADWVPLKTVETPPDTATGVTTAQQFGCVDVDTTGCCTWMVEVTDTANPANKRCIEINGLNDGTAAADAANVDCSQFAKLKVGSNFNADIDVVLTGTGATQQMCVEVSSTEAAGVDVKVVKVA